MRRMRNAAVVEGKRPSLTGKEACTLLKSLELADRKEG